MITGAIVSVLVLYNRANAKAMAPEGAAEFSISISFQRFGLSPICSSVITIIGRPNNLIVVNTVILVVNFIPWRDKITPRAKSVRGAAPAPTKLSVVKIGLGVEIFPKFAHKAKKIVNKTGFFANLKNVFVNETFLFANKSVVIMKNAKVKVASHTTIAVIGTLSDMP